MARELCNWHLQCGFFEGQGWLEAAEAATIDRLHETFNGLRAFVVPGSDAYSVAQRVPFVPHFSGVIATTLNGLAQLVKLRRLRTYLIDSGEILPIGRWHGARSLVSRGRALDDLRTAVSRAARAVPDRARTFRDLPRAGRRDGEGLPRFVEQELRGRRA